MACRGVHFAITSGEAERLLAAKDDDELREVVEAIEEKWEAAHETDKAWDAIHRCLSDGTLDADGGEPPLNRVIWGGRTLNSAGDYFVVLVTPDEVREIADALAGVSESWLRERYFELPFPAYDQGEKSEEDWKYTMGNFEGLPAFFAHAATAGRYVIFTVSV